MTFSPLAFKTFQSSEVSVCHIHLSLLNTTFAIISPRCSLCLFFCVGFLNMWPVVVQACFACSIFWCWWPGHVVNYCMCALLLCCAIVWAIYTCNLIVSFPARVAHFPHFRFGIALDVCCTPLLPCHVQSQL